MTNDRKELLKKTASNQFAVTRIFRTLHPSSSFNFLIYFFASRKSDDGNNLVKIFLGNENAGAASMA
jgi:hypothetical protein